MIRVAVSVEGQTEEEFVKRFLAVHLRAKGVDLTPILLGRARGIFGGGSVSVERLATDMARLIWGYDRVTSLVDFYGFRDKNTSTPEHLEQHILETVDEKINRSWNPLHVIPYIQQHEFEGLLFSDVNVFTDFIGAPKGLVKDLQKIRSQFSTPEDINDNQNTAPSKRIKKLIPRYDKKLDGPRLIEKIGLATLRTECPRFNDWVTGLEALGE